MDAIESPGASWLGYDWIESNLSSEGSFPISWAEIFSLYYFYDGGDFISVRDFWGGDGTFSVGEHIEDYLTGVFLSGITTFGSRIESSLSRIFYSR